MDRRFWCYTGAKAMMRRVWMYLAVIGLGIALCPAAQETDKTARVIREGQDAIYRLDYPEAANIFKQLIQQEPDNPVGHGMLAVVYWNDLLFRTGNLTLDDYATPTPFSKEPAVKLKQPEVQRVQALFHQANDRLLQVCETRLLKDPRDTAALYFKGVHFENLAAEAVAITKSSRQAISYGNTAKSLHTRVLELDPGFTDAYVSLASHEFARATLPWSIKWLSILLQGRANKERALRNLELVAARGKYRQLDAQVLMALLQSWKGDARKAVEIFRRLHASYPQNYLLDINTAAILEQKLNDPKAALAVYRDLQKNQASKAWQLCPGEIYYRTGRTFLRLREYSSALASFQQALQAKNAERETEPLAYFHMAQIYEEQGDSERAVDCYRHALHYQGTGLADELSIARRKVR